MVRVPEWFEEALESEGGGRWRLRWSRKRECFQLEEKAGRGREPDRPLSSLDDEAIRRKDGYDLKAEIAPGTQVRCERCARWTPATVGKMKTTRCIHCRREMKISYWPLGWGLLEHIRKIDIHRGGVERVEAEQDREEAARVRGLQRQLHNNTEAIWKEDFNYAFDIQSVGYTGKEKAWER